MLDVNASYMELSKGVAQDNVHSNLDAAILTFPFKAPKVSGAVVPMSLDGDIIDRRMNAPLCSNEMTAILDMIKHRAKQLGQAIWITTGIFLTAMCVEELGDLRRCDFVHAVECLVTLNAPTQS